MAYSSKYYDPQKAHDYYMRTRELKGYENRYGGARGNGTSLASGGSLNEIRSGQKSKQEKHNSEINSKIAKVKEDLQYNLSVSESEDDVRFAKRDAADRIQRLKQQTKGGSTAGFNEKGKAAAAFIKNQMEKERDELTKQANKSADNEMLGKVRALSDDFKAAREAGFNTGGRKKFASRIKSLLGETKKAKIKATQKRKAEYQQKYKDEIDKLREDDSMFSYYDRRAEQDRKYAERQERKQQAQAKREAKRQAAAKAKAERAAKKQTKTKKGRKSSITVPDTVTRGEDKIWRKK